ncbi:MATE family efflux transporter [Sphingosinicella humi]|uniref:Multidrug-efflux transporter n=1 Tax=Allosphingosinicella humi TaxID=2068657 RepID=A0A2U2J149_9SPHN|nr:MATE family efflux transporter [Sphingosinicella humi]PWG02058.1 MATE family efflux transporter [Sphingosinicella humi]
MLRGTSISEIGLWRREVRATLLLAYPLILTNLAQATIHATDVVLLGWVGPRALAAGALGVNLFNACLIFGTGLVTASAPMMARELGRFRHSVRDVRRTVRQAMWAAVAVAIPCWMFLWQAASILLFLGQEPDLAAEAALFVRAVMWGLLPYFFYLILRSFISALEKPIWSLIVGGVAVIFNAGLNYCLIFGAFGFPALGLLGAGIGSALSNLLMFVGLAVVVVRHRSFRRYRLFGRFWRADWERFREIWRLGLPIAVTLFMEVSIFNAAVFLMGLISTAALAAHAIAIQIAALSFMVPLGLAQAVTVRVGLAAGRRDPAGIARAGWTSFALGEGFMALMALLMLTAPYLLVHGFLDETDPRNAEVITLAVSFLAVAALFQIVDGAQAVGAGMLRGLHDTTVPMIYAALGYWVIGLGSGVALAFGLGWGGIGIWTGLALGLAVVAVLMVTRWMRRDALGLTSR